MLLAGHSSPVTALIRISFLAVIAGSEFNVSETSLRTAAVEILTRPPLYLAPFRDPSLGAVTIESYPLKSAWFSLSPPVIPHSPLVLVIPTPSFEERDEYLFFDAPLTATKPFYRFTLAGNPANKLNLSRGSE
jgi:hypothetical protein